MSTIGPDVVINGELSSNDDLTIEGRVHGHVAVRDGTIVIQAAGRIEADVRAPRVLVHGEVRGAIFASERLELGPSASVEGSLSASQIVIAEGAHVNATIDMGRRTIAARVAEYRAGRAAE
jgi:cytoskeletal protein CcmA (bactofilin family)